MSEHIWHRPPFTPAHRGNSRRGLIKAYDAQAWGIDIDILLSRSTPADPDGIPIACHWQRPLRFDSFYDPRGKLSRNARVSELLGHEVFRLRTRGKNPYRIRAVSHLMRWNVRLAESYQRDPLVLCLEVKPDPRFGRVGVYERLLTEAADIGCPIRIMTQPRGGVGLEYAQAAKAAGAQVILLRRGRVGKPWLAVLGEGDRIKHRGRLWTPDQAMRRGL